MNLPRCRIYLRVPPGTAPEAALRCLAAALEAGDVAALLIGGNGGEESTITMHEALAPLAQEHDVAIVVAGDAGLARQIGADGVEVSGRVHYDAARRQLGSSAIVGAACATSRHLAMETGEAGADYVGFSNGAAEGGDLIAWWAELFEVPCVALDPVAPAQAGDLARRGADFVCPAETMWASPEAARRLVSETLHALAEATR